MRLQLQPLVLLFVLLLFSCEREIETDPVDFGYEYQPLEIGLFWIYEVDQTIYFGENDNEQSDFFYKDKIRSFYINEEEEQVFIVNRSKSLDKDTWILEYEYTMIQRDFSLIRTIENQPIVSLVFPPKPGKVWDGNAYRNSDTDEFEYESTSIPDQYVVKQEDSTDDVTYFDHRYEVYEKGVGLTERYDEVLKYCSRNDCLGNQLIDSGHKTLMKLMEYGKN